MSGQRAVPSIPRVPAIDGLRGIAILCVICHHSFIATPASGANTVDMVVDRVLALFMPFSVDLFFAISGFLITSILDRTREANHPMRTFYARRALRIIPLYYAFLLFVVLFLNHLPERIVGAPGATTWQFLFLTNIQAAFQGASVGRLYPHFWTLGVEEQFYLLWPLIILVLPRRANLAVCCGLMITSVIVRFVLVSMGSLEAGFSLPGARFDALAAGSIVALLYRRNPDYLRKHWKRVCRFAAVGFVATPIATYALYALNATYVALVFWATLMPFLGSVLYSASIAGLAFRNERGGGPRWLVSPVLTSAARYSYGMFVFHMPMIVLLFHYGLVVKRVPVAGLDMPYRVGFFLLIAGLSYGVGVVTWHLYEKRWLKLAPRYVFTARAPDEADAISLQPGPMPVP